MNVRKLKGRMLEEGVTQELLAKSLGSSRSTVHRRLNEHPDELTVGEAKKISRLLGLSDTDKLQIFFDQ